MGERFRPENEIWFSSSEDVKALGYLPCGACGSTKSDKYHYSSCRWAEKILPQNQILFVSSVEPRAAGYVPCGVCNPP